MFSLQIRHDNTVTWLAFWKDPISTKDFKYVWLAANSVFKSDSDLAKYEKARKLKVNFPNSLLSPQTSLHFLSMTHCLTKGAEVLQASTVRQLSLDFKPKASLSTSCAAQAAKIGALLRYLL